MMTTRWVVARFANLTIHKEELCFSAGHFTVFSATEREQLHGHNYMVSVTFNIAIEHNGLSFDYRLYKQKLKKLCNDLDRHFLLPTQSPYLQIEQDDDHIFAHHHQKKIPFLKEDVILLPLTNITIEELAYWFLQQLHHQAHDFAQHAISGMVVEVYNGPGQSARAQWTAQDID